jgi:phosphoribosylglycinamide formyltransferase-1
VPAVLTVGILASGSGTNLQAILDRVADGSLAVRVAVVLSNRAGAGALARAERAEIPTVVLDHRTYASREAFDAAVTEVLRAADVDLVVLAGFDRLVTSVLLQAFPQRVINIHPALLPAFTGLHAQRQALDYGVRIAGATVHFVDEAVDHGPIILQAAVAIDADDSPDDVSARILGVEHQIYPMAIRLIAEGRVQIEGRRVRILGPTPPLPAPLVRRW